MMLSIINRHKILTAFCALSSYLIFPALTAIAQPKFLRPPDYQPYFQQCDRFKYAQTIELCGRWQFKTVKSRDWDYVDLPASWIDYQGSVLFRLSFTLDTTLVNRNAHLVSLGISRRCSVQLNGEFIGQGEGPQLNLFLPSNILHWGKSNYLEIEVDNSLHPLYTIPAFSGALQPANYGGITGDIFLLLETSPSLRLNAARTTLLKNNTQGQLSVPVQILQSPLKKTEARLNCILYDPSGKPIIANQYLINGEDSLDLQMTVAKPLLWSHATPNLYSLHCYLKTADGDTAHYLLRTGFRDLKVTDGFLLNGNNLQLRGLKYWQVNEFGCTFSADQYYDDLDLIRLSGANALLLPEPAHPFWLQLCDSAGIMLLQSTAIYALPNQVFTLPAFQKLAFTKIHNLLQSEAGHISVIAWVLGLDLESDFPSQTLLKYISNKDSRPVLFGIKDDPSKLVLASKDSSESPNPAVIIDIGPQLTEDTEKAQSYQVNQIYSQLQKYKSADAVFLRSFADWNANHLISFQKSALSQNIAYLGVVRQNRQPRIIHQRLQNGWFEQYTQEVSPQNPPENLLFPLAGLGLLMTLILCIRNNKVFKDNLIRVFSHSHGFYSDIRNRRFIQKLQTLIVGFSSILILSLVGAEMLFHLHYSPAFDYVIAHIFYSTGFHPQLILSVQAPLLTLIYLYLCLLIFYLISGFIFKIITAILRQRITLAQSLTFTFWANAGFLWFAPVTVFFYKGLSIPLVRNLEIYLLILFLIWNFFRFMNALRVASASTFLKVFLIYAFFSIIILGSTLIYFQNSCALLYYYHYFVNYVL